MTRKQLARKAFLYMAVIFATNSGGGDFSWYQEVHEYEPPGSFNITTPAIFLTYMSFSSRCFQYRLPQYPGKCKTCHVSPTQNLPPPFPVASRRQKQNVPPFRIDLKEVHCLSSSISQSTDEDRNRCIHRFELCG